MMLAERGAVVVDADQIAREVVEPGGPAYQPMIDRFGAAFTFWVYAAMCIAALFFCVKVVPETKGRTLEEIEASWG